MADAPSELEVLRAALAAAHARADAMAGEAARARAAASGAEAVIATLRLEVEKLQACALRAAVRAPGTAARPARAAARGARGHSGRGRARRRAGHAAETRPAPAARGASSSRAQAVPRAPGPRERVVVEAPCACAACGSGRIVKLDEDITETLEVVPRSWKVIQTVREKFVLPRLRGDHPATRAVPPHAPRLGRAELPRDAAVREVRPASAAQPSG